MGTDITTVDTHASEKTVHDDELNDDRRQLDIAERAYALFVARGSEPGYEIDDWLAAERELTAPDLPPVQDAQVTAKGEDSRTPAAAGRRDRPRT